MKRRAIIAAGLVLSLAAGCAPQPQGADAAAQACAKRGLTPQTPAFADCEMQENQVIDAQRASLQKMQKAQDFRKELNASIPHR